MTDNEKAEILIDIWEETLYEYTKTRYISEEEANELASIFNRNLLTFCELDIKN